MQPPPGFAAPVTTGQLSNQQPSTTAQPHTKLISAGSEIESKSLPVIFQFLRLLNTIIKHIKYLYYRSINNYAYAKCISDVIKHPCGTRY